MPPLKSHHISPSDEEDARTDESIATDSDNPALDEDWFAAAKPARSVLGDDVVEALESKRRGRPKGTTRPSNKIRTTTNLDADIVAWIKGDNPKGWQTRLNARLRELMEQDQIAGK